MGEGKLWSRWCGIVALWVTSLVAGQSQGVLPSVTLATGGVLELVRAVRPLGPLGNGSSAVIQFDLAYATDEDARPLSLGDGMVCSLVDPLRARGTIIAMLDPNGLVVGPSSVGLVTLRRADVHFEPINWSSYDRPYRWQAAYHASVIIPAELRSGNLELYVDLFDNFDPLESRVWVSSLEVVPEPSATSWIPLGFAGILGLLRGTRPGQRLLGAERS